MKIDVQNRTLRPRGAALLLAFVLAMAVSAAPAALAEPYYEGKTISLIMGLDPSSGGATVGRLLAKHLALTIEGTPTVIVKYMTGAGLMKAHRHVLAKAPRDGTTVYYGPRSPLGELLRRPGVTFKYTDFTVLGGVQISGLVIYARTDAAPGLTGAGAIIGAPDLIYGGISAEHGRMLISMFGLDLLGARYTFVPGYGGSGKIRAAIITGEINVATDSAHAYLNNAVPQLVDKGKGLALFSIPLLTGDGRLIKNSLLPDVLSFPELHREITGAAPAGPAWEAMKTLIEIDQTMQHVLLGPPGMNAAARQALGDALAPAMRSDAFADEARRVLTYVPEAVGPARAREILAATARVPPRMVEFIKAYIDSKSGM